MSNIDKQALRADAMEATGGSWVRESGEGWEEICCDDDQGNAGFIIAEFQGENATANRKFVQSVNPATVLALLDELETAKKCIAELEAEPVSQAYNLPELIEGMEVSIDVSTCDADLGNRYFGTVTEASELDTAKNGYILLVQDVEPNFDINGNSPGTPDSWISCSERMPAQDDWILIYSKHGEYMAGQVQGEYVELSDGTLSWLGNALYWMPLPEPPQEAK